MDLSVGQVIADRYKIEERLGRGAMGTVYRARHVKLNRPFAIKVLHPPLTANDKLRRRFQREAETASSLRHKNLVGVIDIGETGHLVYLVMELADGVPLSEVIAQAPLPSRRVIDYMRQLCDGLQAAHDAGLIHRDFKPDNVIVERDRDGVETLRIIDFGIAILRGTHATEERERLTTEGIVLGTPHYMAPEHASGETVDHRIDLFALGVICFEMLTGRMPFDGDGVDVARSNMLYDTPAMTARVPFLEVDPLLEALTRQMMARDRDNRIASAKTARDILDLIEKDRGAAAVALGLQAPAPVLAPAPPPATVDRPRQAIVALPVPVGGRVRGAPNTLEPVVSTLPTEVMRPRRRFRGALIGGGIAIAMLGVVLAAGLTRGDEVAQQIATDVETAAEPIVIQAEPPPPPEIPVPVQPSPAPAPVVTFRPTKKITTPAPPVHEETRAVAPPTAVQVAELYGAVGRKLGHLQQSKGSDATIDLWPRFRHIRINDAIATADSRRDTQRLLEQLQRDVEGRR